MAESTSSKKTESGSEIKEGGLPFNPKDLLKIVFKWWVVIVLVGAVTAVLAFFYARIGYEPYYTASATMIVSTSNSYQQTYSSLFAARNLTDSYKIVLKSTVLMKEIAEDLQLDMSAAALKNSISISDVSGTEVMKVTVVTNDAEMSVQIANSFVKLAQKVIDEKLGVGYISSLDQAVGASQSSVQKSSTKYGMYGFLIGAGIVAVLVILIELLRDTVKSPDDVYDKLRQHSFGVIPVYKKRMQINGKEIIPLIDSPSAEFAFIEAYKTLRARLETLHVRNGDKVVLISSSVEKEGKTTVSTNTAITLAQTGKRVILLDCDLRKPSVNVKLGLKQKNTVGLRPILEGTSTVQDAIIHDEMHDIDVILSGRALQSPTELLGSPRMHDTIEELKTMYDYVIIDSPPSSFMTDSVLLSNFCDVVLLVVKHDYLPREIIVKTMQGFADAGRKINGIVLNSFGYSTSGLGYYKYGYNYYGGYHKRKYYTKYYSKYDD